MNGIDAKGFVRFLELVQWRVLKEIAKSWSVVDLINLEEVFPQLQQRVQETFDNLEVFDYEKSEDLDKVLNGVLRCGPTLKSANLPNIKLLFEQKDKHDRFLTQLTATCPNIERLNFDAIPQIEGSFNDFTCIADAVMRLNRKFRPKVIDTIRNLHAIEENENKKLFHHVIRHIDSPSEFPVCDTKPAPNIDYFLKHHIKRQAKDAMKKIGLDIDGYSVTEMANIITTFDSLRFVDVCVDSEVNLSEAQPLIDAINNHPNLQSVSLTCSQFELVDRINDHLITKLTLGPPRKYFEHNALIEQSLASKQFANLHELVLAGSLERGAGHILKNSNLFKNASKIEVNSSFPWEEVREFLVMRGHLVHKVHFLMNYINSLAGVNMLRWLPNIVSFSACIYGVRVRYQPGEEVQLRKLDEMLLNNPNGVVDLVVWEELYYEWCWIYLRETYNAMPNKTGRIRITSYKPCDIFEYCIRRPSYLLGYEPHYDDVSDDDIDLDRLQ